MRKGGTSGRINQKKNIKNNHLINKNVVFVKAMLKIKF